MNKLRRRNDIVEYINEKGFVSFSELKDRFPDNSEMTLRTDLKELDAQGRINRVRGGARGHAARRPEIWTGYDASGGLGHFAAAGFALCAGRGGLFLTCR